MRLISWARLSWRSCICLTGGAHPEQNSKFTDHYLEIDYDLSDVLFITTSNSLDISLPLLDRMEVIRLSGYTEKEKLHIASEHLLEKNFSRVGLEPNELRLGASVIPAIIKNYTREAGVRELDRCINKICRKALKAIVEQDKKNKKNITISAKSLQKYLGPVRHQHNMKFSSDNIGKIQGLAWTPVGGELLTIESVIYPGKGKYVYTGSLGDVMKESIQTAISIVKLEAKNHDIVCP